MSILMTTQNQGSNSASLVRLLFSWASPSFWSVFLPGKAAQHLEEINWKSIGLKMSREAINFFGKKNVYIYIYGYKIETKITLAMFKISFSIMQKINFRYLFIYFFKLKIEKSLLISQYILKIFWDILDYHGNKTAPLYP